MSCAGNSSPARRRSRSCSRCSPHSARSRRAPVLRRQDDVTVSNANLRYLEASINSASPEELIIKVYDALLLFARQAIEVMESRPADIQARHDLLRRAQRACALLMGSLR